MTLKSANVHVPTGETKVLPQTVHRQNKFHATFPAPHRLVLVPETPDHANGSGVGLSCLAVRCCTLYHGRSKGVSVMQQPGLKIDVHWLKVWQDTDQWSSFAKMRHRAVTFLRFFHQSWTFWAANIKGVVPRAKQSAFTCLKKHSVFSFVRGLNLKLLKVETVHLYQFQI